MNYLLNEEQDGYCKTLQRFVQEKADSHFLHRLADQKDGWQQSLHALWQDFAELGFTGLLVPTDYEGLGLSLQDCTLTAEILGAHTTPLPFFSHQLCCLAITLAGSPEQKAHWLPKLARGEVVGSIAFHSSNGFQPQDWQADANGTGNISFAHCPTLGSLDIPHLIVAGLRHGALGLIDTHQHGVTLHTQPCADLTRHSAQVTCEVAQIDILPEGSQHSATLFHAGLALLAADSVGGIQACIERAAEYAKVREQFGVTIGQFQAVKHQIAEIALHGEPNRPLCHYAAYTVDAGPPDAARIAALAKTHLCDAYLATARQTVELHGGFGYTWEADIHFYLKRALFNAAFLGNSRQLRSRLSPAR